MNLVGETVAKPVDFERVQSFMTRVMDHMGGAMVGLMCTLGDRMGLFRVLASHGSMTSEDFAKRAGIRERYAREWLRAVSSAGYVDYDPTLDRYWLSPEHALVLAAEDSPMFLGGAFQQLAGLSRPLDLLCEAFRYGGGVPQEAYGEDLLSGMERMSATWFENMLVQHWLPTTTTTLAKLERGADVADVGCGSGRALIRLAKVFPRSRFVGYDAFSIVVERARRRAEAADLSTKRLRFEHRAIEDGLTEQFDVIMAFDSLHDMPEPLVALAAIRRSLQADGTFLLSEMNCEEQPARNFGLNGTILYGTSVLYNTPVALSNGKDAPGTMGLPESLLRRLCIDAGFASIRRLPVMNPFNILYEVLP